MIKYLILFIGFTSGIFVLTSQLRKPHKNTADLLLISWLLIAEFHLVYYFLFFNYFLTGQALLIAIGSTLPLFHITFITGYIKSQLGIPVKKMLIINGIFTGTYILLFYFIIQLGFISEEDLMYRLQSSAPLKLKIISLSYFLYYLLLTISVLKSVVARHQFQPLIVLTSNKFSRKRGISYWSWSYLIGSVVVVINFILLNADLITYQASILSFCLMITWQIFFIGQFEVSTDQTLKDTGVSEKYKASGLKEDDKTRLKEQLQHYLISTKAFLDPDLSLSDLAKGVEIPPYQLSQLINETLATNYSDLINTYRVNEFKQKLAQGGDEKLSILGLAQESGFNSKSGFYKTFKKLTGLSPTDYKKSLKESTPIGVH